MERVQVEKPQRDFKQEKIAHEAENQQIAAEDFDRQRVATATGKTVIEGIDELLEDVDSALLGINAQEFVRGYIQTGGQ